MARNRTRLPPPYTRHDVLADRFYADPTLMEAVCACTLDGRADCVARITLLTPEHEFWDGVVRLAIVTYPRRGCSFGGRHVLGHALRFHALAES